MRDQTVSVKHGWIIIFLLNSENGFFAKRFSSRGGERGLPSAIHPPLALQETVRGSFL